MARRTRDRLLGLPMAAAVATAIVALDMMLVAFDNITDFGTNRAFVQHVLAMDTTFQDPDLMWRAVTRPGLQIAGYVLIIAWETATALVLIGATIAWVRGLFTGAFERCRRMTTVGLAMAIALFGGAFLGVGGEWFAMWQSSQWNGLVPAFRNFTMAAFGLVLVHLPSRDWDEAR